MAFNHTDEQLKLVIEVLGELYYKDSVPVDRYKNASGWYEDAVVVDCNAIDYKLWKLTGKRFGYDGLTREDFIKDYAKPSEMKEGQDG
jgi:hypothetical protein